MPAARVRGYHLSLMAAKDTFAEYCAELLGSLGSVQVRRMFGGHGFYVDGVFLAIATGETLYLKTDSQTAPAFSEAGCSEFVYEVHGSKKVSLHYWSVPVEAMDSPHRMEPWARLALEAALRARAAKPPRKIREQRPNR
jgi:DNA transformation protein